MKLYVSFAQESTYVLQGTVTADAADGDTTVAYTLTSGSVSDVLPDMEVEFLRSGVITGRLRIRGAGTTSTALHVNEFSAGTVQVLSGDTFRVIRAWRIRPRLPSATVDFNPDSEPYTDQHEDPAPVATSGGHKVGFAADLSAVQHSGGGFVVSVTSSPSSIGHNWSMPGSNTSTSASPTFDYSGLSGGTYWGAHTVEDTDNSKTTTQRVCIRVHDDNDLPYDITSADITGTPENASTATVTMPGAVDIDDVPDGAMGWVWSPDYGILFEGYLVRDTIEKDPDSETISFEMVSARGILENLPGFSTVLDTVAEATTWLEAKGLTVEDAIIYRLRELATVLNLCDLEIDEAWQYPFPQFYLQEQVPYAQVQELADGVDCLFTCTRANKLRIAKPVYYMDSDERTAASTQTTLTSDNTRTLNETREHRYPYNLVEGRGFAGDAPVFSRAPGIAPSEGPQKTTVERQIVFNQLDLNERTGRRYARLNLLKNGLPTRKVSVTVLPSLYGLDPALCDQWVTLNNITTYRGLTHSNTRFSLESYTETWDAEAEVNPEITLELQEETDGVAGITYIPPENPIEVIDDGDFFDDDDYTTPDTIHGLPLDASSLFALASGNHYWWAYTGALNEWDVAINLVTLGINGDPLGAVYDGGDAWLVTTEEAVKLLDYAGTPSLGTPYTLANYPIVNRTIEKSRSVAGAVWVMTYYGSFGPTGTTCEYTHNDGSSWGETLLTSGYDNNVFNGANISNSPGLWVDQHGASAATTRIFTSAVPGSGAIATPDSDGYYSTDGGQTFTRITSPSASLPDIAPNKYSAGAMWAAYEDTAPAAMYFGRRALHVPSGNQDTYLYRSINGGTPADISPQVGGNPYGPGFGAQWWRAIALPDDDVNSLILCGHSRTAANFAVFLTRNAQAATPSWTELVAPGNLTYWGCYFVNRNIAYFYGPSGNVGYWNGGATINDIGIPGGGDIYALMGR